MIIQNSIISRILNLEFPSVTITTYFFFFLFLLLSMNLFFTLVISLISLTFFPFRFLLAQCGSTARHFVQCLISIKKCLCSTVTLMFLNITRKTARCTFLDLITWWLSVTRRSHKIVPIGSTKHFLLNYLYMSCAEILLFHCGWLFTMLLSVGSISNPFYSTQPDTTCLKRWLWIFLLGKD